MTDHDGAALPDALETLVEVEDAGMQMEAAEPRFVAAEARIAVQALVRGRDAAKYTPEVLLAWYCVRLLTEVGIRLRWIAGPSAERPDADGTPLIDRGESIERIARLAKRDYLESARSYAAVNQIRTEAGAEPGDAETLIAELQHLADRIAVDPAPKQVAELAGASREGRMLYAGFRQSSSIIHPGAALGRIAMEDDERVTGMLETAAFLCAAYAASIMEAVR